MADQEESSISDLQQQVNELKTLVRFQAQIMDSLPCPLVVIDSQMNILKTNQPSVALAREKQLIGKHLLSVIPEFQTPSLKSAIEKTIREKIFQTVETELAGTSMVHHIGPLQEDTGLESVVIISCPSIDSEDVRINEFMRDKYISLGEFAGKVAHDINNPLSVIITRMDYLQSIDLENAIEEGEVEIMEEVGIINRQAMRIYDILDKVGALKMQGKEEPVTGDITDVVSRAVTIAEFQRPNKSIHAVKEIPTGFPEIVCNEIKLERAIKEIVTNAFEAVGEQGDVKIELLFNGPWYIIKVTDSGVGIQTENIKRLFDPFYTTKQGIKGAGLGLTIAYGAALAHHGRIDVQSTPGKGTAINMYIKSLV